VTLTSNSKSKLELWAEMHRIKLIRELMLLFTSNPLLKVMQKLL